MSSNFSNHAIRSRGGLKDAEHALSTKPLEAMPANFALLEERVDHCNAIPMPKEDREQKEGSGTEQDCLGRRH